MGSPPPQGSKKAVLKLRSNKSKVKAPANTGRDNKRRKAVKKTDQAKRDMSSRDKPAPRIFEMVTIKLMAPRIEDTPARCNDKIAKSTEEPGCPRVERGG